jgi:hypothetical protein
VIDVVARRDGADEEPVGGAMGGLAAPEAVAAGIPAPPPQRATGGWVDVDHDLLARGQPARGPPPALDSELVVYHAVIARRAGGVDRRHQSVEVHPAMLGPGHRRPVATRTLPGFPFG